MDKTSKVNRVSCIFTIGLAIAVLETINLVHDAASIGKFGVDLHPTRHNFGKSGGRSDRNLAPQGVQSLNAYTNSLFKYIARGVRYEKNSTLRSMGNEILSLLPASFVREQDNSTITDYLRKTTLVIDELTDNNQGYIKTALKLNIKIVTNLKPDKQSLDLNYVPVSSKTHYKSLLKALVDKVTTEFVIISRGTSLNLDPDKIMRVIKHLSDEKSDVVGTSIIDSTKQWKLGCFITKILWFQYRIVEGFDTKDSEGFYRCDYLAGAFAVKTSLVKTFLNLRQSMNVARENVIPQFFRDMTSQNKVVHLDPGIVSTVKAVERETHSSSTKELALNFCMINSLSVFYTAHGQKYEFLCNEVKMACYAARGKGFLMSKCCHKDLDDLLMKTIKEMELQKWHYTLVAGTAIGSLKLEMTLPWELDHDFQINSTHLIPLRSMAQDFRRKYGYQFIYEMNGIEKCIKSHGYLCGWIGIKSNYWRMEVIGRGILMDDIIREGKDVTLYSKVENSRVKGLGTRTLMSGHWMWSTASPGSYLRLKYGRECLKHVRHIYTMHMSKNTNYYRRKIYQWQECERPGHHACFREFPADGNLGYKGVSV